MQATVLYNPRDVRFETRDDPKILKPTDAIASAATPAAVSRNPATHFHAEGTYFFSVLSRCTRQAE